MYFKITYGWHAEENRGKTAELDKAIEQCLDEFGFFPTNARFDMAKGERYLEFETHEMVFRPASVLKCPHCGEKTISSYDRCIHCNEKLEGGD